LLWFILMHLRCVWIVDFGPTENKGEKTCDLGGGIQRNQKSIQMITTTKTKQSQEKRRKHNAAKSSTHTSAQEYVKKKMLRRVVISEHAQFTFAQHARARSHSRQVH